MPDEFQIGTTISMTSLETVLSANVPIEPDWSYRPFSVVVLLVHGKRPGNGLPVIKWRFNQILQSHREVLRETSCPVPLLSKANIYISTPITETSSGDLVC